MLALYVTWQMPIVGAVSVLRSVYHILKRNHESELDLHGEGG